MESDRAQTEGGLGLATKGKRDTRLPVTKEPAWGCDHKGTSKVKFCSLTTSQHWPIVLEKMMFSDLERLHLRNSLSYLTCYLFTVWPSTSLVLTWPFNSTNAIDQHPLKTGPPLLFVTQLSPRLLLTPFLWQTDKPMTVGSWASSVPLSPLCLSTLIHTYSFNASQAQRSRSYTLAWVILSWTSRTRSSTACFSLQYLRVPQMRAHASILMKSNQVFCLTEPPLYLYFFTLPASHEQVCTLGLS